MPWVEALLRGQKVLAKANEQGQLLADGGRVEIRYKASDTRAYRASVANLTPAPGARVLPDSECADAAFVEKKPEADDKRPGGRAAVASVSSNPLEGAFIAYTDGACSGNPGPAGAGFIVIAPNGQMAEGYEFLGDATNNVGELTAILRALQAMPSTAPELVVHTDSSYAIGVLQKGWKAKVNQALIAETKAVIKAKGRVRIVYVPGHSGVPLNERADELAREAIRTRRSKGIG